MKGRKLKIVVMMLLILMTTRPVIARAASNIDEITINVTDNELLYPTLTVSDARYSIVKQTTWNRSEEKLYVGAKTHSMITLTPANGYEFAIGSRKDIVVAGNGADYSTFTYVAHKDVCYITVTYTINGVPEAPSKVYWDEKTPWVAKVEPVVGCDKYKFELYAGDTLIKQVTTSATRCELSKELTKADICESENVYVKVKAIFRGKESKENVSEAYTYWEELKAHCDKVYDREWKWTK